MKNLIKSLSAIQSELKAPKSQYNSFGKYKYRNCEDIMEAVKPLLSKHGMSMVITDQVIEKEGRFYVEAEVILFDKDGESLSVTAWAREEENKKERERETNKARPRVRGSISLRLQIRLLQGPNNRYIQARHQRYHIRQKAHHPYERRAIPFAYTTDRRTDPG